MAWIRGKLLGAGAFGSVNLAINREDGEVFAVKSVVVNDGSEVAVRAIENEISMLQELESRYVVRCLGSDWTEEGGELKRNVFLEYMPEGCLTDFVKQFASSGSLDEHLLRTYTRSVVEGIEYLHSRGIVHCDVKGKNVLVGNGCVKLTDFGSAKRVGAMAEKVEKVNGTPLWMAPEVVRQVEQGPASDIWSLGCTVVEMATGRAPWSNLAGMNHFVALYHIGCTDELPAVPASLSAEAHDFLSHCFQRDPRRRWTSAQLLKHPFLTERFVPAAPSSPTSAMEFPAHDATDSDNHNLSTSSFTNSVPTLAAPSLFKRGLVSAPPKLQAVPVEENSWSSLAASPWIVVRSPKSASSPPSFALSDWMTSPASPSSVEAPIAPTQCDNFEPDCEPSEIFVDQNTLTSAAPVITSLISSAIIPSSETKDGPISQIFASRFDFPHFAISEMGSCIEAGGNCASKLSGSEKLRFFAMGEEDDHGALGCTSLNLGFAVLISSVAEYSEHVYQYSNPRILLYWWRGHRKGLLESSYSRGSERVWLNCGHWDQCIIAFLDQYTSPLILQNTTPPAYLIVPYLSPFFNSLHLFAYSISSCLNVDASLNFFAFECGCSRVSHSVESGLESRTVDF